MTPEQRRAIEWDSCHLVSKFYHYLDERQYEQVASLFTDDGTWVRMGEQLDGKPRILEVMQQRSETLAIRHVLSNLVVDVKDDSSSRVAAYVTLYTHNAPDGLPDVPVLEQPLALWALAIDCARTGDDWKIRFHNGERIMVREGTPSL